MKIRLLTFFANASLSAAAIAFLITPLQLTPQPEGYLFMTLLLAVVSGGIRVSCHLATKNDPLAERALPASLVAYGLFLLIATRWLDL